MEEKQQSCACDISKIESDILAKLQESNPKEYLNIDDWGMGIQCKSFTGKLYNEFRYEYTFIKRNGEKSTPKTRTAQYIILTAGFAVNHIKLTKIKHHEHIPRPHPPIPAHTAKANCA